MFRTRKAVIAAAIVGSMLAGGAVGATVFSAGASGAATSPSSGSGSGTSTRTFKPNEDKAHEARESVQREAQENAGQVPTVP